ncbi:hypothetical protein B0J18DRAFT_119888 [Chaetomium sp. MPI-SDFR-AT-0129]|nr:hypothetical protein B0J18DRAFT_119888 [Chaetomium sp. MPI-SDFR-AT-0129]
MVKRYVAYGVDGGDSGSPYSSSQRWFLFPTPFPTHPSAGASVAAGGRDGYSTFRFLMKAGLRLVGHPSRGTKASRFVALRLSHVGITSYIGMLFAILTFSLFLFSSFHIHFPTHIIWRLFGRLRLVGFILIVFGLVMAFRFLWVSLYGSDSFFFWYGFWSLACPIFWLVEYGEGDVGYLVC